NPFRVNFDSLSERAQVVATVAAALGPHTLASRPGKRFESLRWFDGRPEPIKRTSARSASAPAWSRVARSYPSRGQSAFARDDLVDPAGRGRARPRTGPPNQSGEASVHQRSADLTGGLYTVSSSFQFGGRSNFGTIRPALAQTNGSDCDRLGD